MMTLFEELGGEEPLRRLVDRFYDLMDTRDDAATIRAMHPEDLSESRDKLFWFVCGWTGGPQHYIQRRGHPRLRRRHMPFAIDGDAAVQWMACMEGALEEQVEDEELRRRVVSAFRHIANHMRNLQSPGDAPGGMQIR